MVEERLKGTPVVDIAHTLGISRAYVYKVLEGFPRGKPDHSQFLGAEKEAAVAVDYLNLLPGQSVLDRNGIEPYVATIVSQIAKLHDLTEAQVYNILYKVTCRHPAISPSPMYPNIERWRKRAAMDQRKLASQCGVSLLTVMDALQGKRELPEKMLQYIQAHSELSLDEILSPTLVERSGHDA